MQLEVRETSAVEASLDLNYLASLTNDARHPSHDGIVGAPLGPRRAAVHPRARRAATQAPARLGFSETAAEVTWGWSRRRPRLQFDV